MIRTIAARLPPDIQHGLKRWMFRRRIKRGDFSAGEPEVARIDEWLSAGDVAIDVGANVGHYALQFSKIVGPTGRVFAFEPVPETFALLAENVQAAHATNVTLINAAASSNTGFAWMRAPRDIYGGTNFYQAQISVIGDYRVACMALDTFDLPKVALLKIDAEGHDLDVLQGARKLILRDSPLLIVECAPEGDIADWLADMGYSVSHIEGSPNCVAVKASLSRPRVAV